MNDGVRGDMRNLRRERADEQSGIQYPLDLKQIQVTDAFWHREQELVRTEVIPYQWEALNDRVEGRPPATVCATSRWQAV